MLRSRIIKPLLLIAFIAACGKLADVTGPRATGLKVRANRATSSVVDPASTPAGLRACWGAEGNAVDSVSAHVGAVSGGVTYGPGRYGQAFWFQNGDADITIANDSVLNVGSGSGMTMTAWIKTLGPEWNGVPGAGPILEYQGGAHLWSHVQYVDPTGALFANLIDSSTYNWNIVQINNLLPANEWVHVAVTYDKVTGQEILYGNGVEIKRETRGAFTPRTWQTLHIGSRVSSDVLGDGKFAFNGLIDDASIYDRALTADEMAGLYLSTESKCKPAPVALAVSQQPAGVESGATMATQPQITLKDLWNNPVTSATNPVTVSLIAGNGVLSGTTTVNAVNGVASFSDLAITGKGVVTLKFTSPGLTAATAGPTVTQVVRQIVVTRQAGGGVSGFPFSTQPVAELRDAGGLLVTTATTAVTATLTNGTGSLVGATTVNAVGGIASFTNLQVNGIGSQTVTFSATGVVPANNGSTTLNVIPGPDAALAVIAQPTSAESGVPFATQPVIEVRDATGARTASTIAITAEIASGPGTLSGRTTVNAVNGRATFTDLTIAGASAGTTLRFSALSLPPVVSAGFPIVQVVRVLAVVANPSATVVSGFALAQQPVVELRDAAGIRMSAATNPVTAAINSGPGTLSGTTMVTPVNGLATFTDLTLSGAGSSTLQFTTPGANTLVSSAIAVTVAPPTQLGITQQPTAVEAGAFFSPVITVDIRDALGGRVAGAVNPVTVSIATGTGTLLGTTTVNAVNGTATFTDLKVSGSGNVTLAFAAAGLTGATSASFAVTPVVRQLVLTTPPSGAISGFALTSQPVVELRDLAGNKVVGATNAVAVAVSSGTPVLSGTTTVNAVNGVATFTNLLLTGTGTSTLSFTVSGATTANSTFNVTAAPAVALGMVTQPSAVESGGAFSTPISVEVRDGLGARVAGGSTPVTATITSGTGQLLGATTVAAVNGLATFSTLKVGGSGSFVLTFSSAGLTTAVSNSFAVTQVVRSLVMVQAPAAAASGIVLGQQPAFQLRDSADIQVAGATNAVSVAVTAGTGVLSGGATTVNAVNGAAQFSGLILTGAGNSTLTFTSGTLTPVSAVVNVTTVAASQLAIQTQPAVLESGALLSTQPVIAVKDLLGNVVAGATPLVTASIASGTATLSGTTSVNAVNGIATFTDLKISGSGPVTLQFSSPALTGATSTSLNVVQNIRGIQIAQTASGAVNGFNFTQQPVIRTVDAGGTLVTAAGPYPVEVYSMTAGATLSGTQAVYAVNGLATFSNLRLTAATVPSVVTLEYRLIGGGTIQQTIIVQAATATQLALTTAPAGFESGVPFTTQPIVQVRDANGNAVATNVAVTATITSGNGTLGGTTTVNATNGVAAFTNLKIAGSGAQTITFSSPGLVSAVSAALNVVQVARAVALTTPPSGAVSGFPLTSQPVASIVDAAGLVVPGAVGQVTATLASGNATLSGTTTVTAVNGIATFTNLALNGSGSATLTFSYTGTTSATSPSITITPAPASQVAITTQPTAVESGVRFTPTIVAEVRDGNGQRVSTATNAVTVTVASGTGTLNGSTTVQAVNGIATFTDLEVAGWGSHQLAFSAVGLSQAVSNAFTVTQVVRNAAVTLQPSGSESGVALAVQPVVELRDSAGLRVVSASQSVTAAVASGTAALSGTVTINAYQGTANFSNLTLSGAGATTLSFASAGVNPAPLSTSLLVTQIPHALSLSTAPAGAVSGLPFTTQPTVTVLDAAGLQVLGGTTVVNVAVQSGPGILSGTTGVAAVNGVVSFSNLRLSGIGTSTLVFSGPGLTTTTATIEVIAPPASGMGLLTQPGGAESGVNLTSQPVVEIRDTFGNRITTANNAITVAVASGSATLTGTTTVTAVNGVATFSDLKLSGSSSVTLSFTATGLSPVTSNLFTVTQQVRQVALIQQPGQAYTNQAFLTQPIVELRDAAGLRATFYNGQLTASVVTGNGTIIGNQLETAVNGVVTFSSLGINGLGSFVLNFKVGNPLATNTANVNSIAFNVTTPPATQLNVVTEPSGAESGVPFTTQPVVELLDQFNTRVTNTSTAVTASIASGPGTLLGTTTVTSNNGLASFSNLKIAGASSGTVLRFAATGLSDELSQPIAVTQVVRSMVATTAPGGAASGALLAPQPTIELRDAAGLIVTSANAPVTASISSGSGTLQGTTTMSALNGVIVYYDLAITGFGANTLTFTYGGSPAISAISTPAVNITAGAPAALAVNAQPTTVESGAAMTAPIAIEVRDAAGNRNTTVSVPVSVSIFSGTGTLTGTTTVSSVNGIATFTNLAIGTAGTPVVLQFTSGALTPVNSASIAVNQVLRQMVVTTPPSGGASGAVFGTQPAIELRDAAGIKLASGSASVTAAIATGTGTLNGTTTVTSVNGVATFTNLSITGSGAYTLRFTSGSVTVNSASFNVTNTAPAKLAIVTQPTATESGVPFGTPVAVEVRDASGIKVANNTSPVTVSFFSGTGVLIGTTTVAAVNGTATFTGLAVGSASGTVTLAFSSTGLTGANSNAFAVTQVLRQAALTTQPSGGTSGTAFTTQPVVELRDAAGLKIATATGTVTASISSGTGTLVGSSTATATAGVATYSGLGITGTGSYALTFTIGTISVTSNAITVTSAAPSQLAITQQPTTIESGAAITPALTVAIKDATGNVVTSSSAAVTVSFNTGTGVLTNATVNAVNGIATFSNLTVGSASGTVKLQVSSGTLAGATTNSITVNQVVRSLALVATPTTATTGTPMAPQPVVELRDAAGLRVVSGTGAVTATVASGLGTLGGTTSVNAVAGQAAFTNLSITGTGMFTLAFNYTNLSVMTSVVTGSITVIGTPSRLVLVGGPTTVESGVTTTPAFTIEVRDANGNRVTSGTTAVTVGLYSSSGVLLGTTTVSSVNGVATFTDLKIGSAAGSVRLQFTSGTLTAAITNAITVTQVVRQMAVVTQPAGAVAGKVFTVQPVIEFRDAAGIKVATATNSVTAALASGSGTLGGTLTVSGVAGTARYTNLQLSAIGAATLSFSSAGLPTVNSASFTVASALTFYGFFDPIEMGRVSVVQAGRVIPFKYAVTGVSSGTDVVLSVTSAQEACVAPTKDDHGWRGNGKDWNDGKKSWKDDEDKDDRDGHGHYDPRSGQRHFNWTTDKAWAGTCRVFTMTLIDGSTHVVHFRFKKGDRDDDDNDARSWWGSDWKSRYGQILRDWAKNWGRDRDSDWGLGWDR